MEFQKIYENHKVVATQVESLYREINKIAMKKPTERITKMMSQKINHIIVSTNKLIKNDEFLAAIETLPIEGELYRYDEALIVIAELRGALDRQWNSPEFLKAGSKRVGERQIYNN